MGFAMQTLHERSSHGRRLAAAFADAIGLLLLIDAALALSPAHSPIGWVFFHLPAWVPLGPALPALIGAAVLLRWRPGIAAAVALAAWNAGEYFRLVSSGAIAGLPVCFSALLAAALVPALRHRRIARPAAVAAAGGVLLLTHLLTFGCTDYRRGAEAVVVFGARAYSPRACSEVLADRTLTGVRLYQQGHAGTLVFSGGGDEPAAMKHLALRRGVPERDIILDHDGHNTAATLRNLRGRFRRVLAVSNYYHNARIKMTADRFGLECYTVPAAMRRRLPGEPKWVLRECLAFAAYYLGLC